MEKNTNLQNKLSNLQLIGDYEKKLQLKATGATIHKASSIRMRLLFLLSHCTKCSSELCPCDIFNHAVIEAKVLLNEAIIT